LPRQSNGAAIGVTTRILAPKFNHALAQVDFEDRFA
jgi:hypothetical protein